MSNATFTFGRFTPVTERGHGKLIGAVQAHAEKTGGAHYIFPSHTQDPKKNPLEHGEKVGFMRRLFPSANVVSNKKVRTAIDAVKHLESKGHTHVTMVVGSDRVDEFSNLLNKYRKKEFPKIKKVSVVSAGQRDPDAEGEEGESASKHRELVVAGKRKEFISKYSDPKLGAEIHDAVKKGMQMESKTPIGIFLLGGPGSGKDYVLKNIFSRFDLMEVQADQVLNGAASELLESGCHIVINGANDASKIEIIQNILEGYTFDFIHVSVTNKVSRLRNELREEPISENKRIDKFLRAEELAKHLDAFVFNNSINLNESSDMEKVFFAAQIERLLERVVKLGLEIQNTTEIKTFVPLKEKVYMPAKYKTGNPKTDAARAAHWKKMSKYSDRNPKAYKDAPGDKKARKEGIPLSPHTIAVRKMMAKEETVVEPKLRRIPRGGNITAVMTARNETGRKIIAAEAAPRPNPPIEDVAKKHNVSVADLEKEIAIGLEIEKEHTLDKKEARRIAIDHLEEIPDYYTRLVSMEKSAKKSMNEDADSSLTAKAKKSGISVSTLRKVYRRGVAAWNSGHRPGTTPQQWGHARVNSYINKGKTYHTADKDLRNEDLDLDQLFERQLEGTDEYRQHAISMTPGQKQEIEDAYKSTKQVTKKETAVKQEETDCCGEQTGETTPKNIREFRKLRAEAKTSEENSAVDTTPKLQTGKETRRKVSKQTRNYNATMDGLPVVAGALAEVKQVKGFMPTPRQVGGVPPGGHPVPPGYERVKSWGGAWELRKIREKPTPTTVKEAVEYHIENQISFTENVFRPGSEMFFEMISEAKKLYKEGKYTPADDWEQDLLESDIGEIVEFEGQQVVLDYPIEEGLEECWSGYVQRGMKKKGDKMVPNCVPVNEEDKTDGKGIGKPWREGGGGAVYVRTGDGGVKKVRFSQSGMKKKFMDPAATRSFVARHRCLTNKDKTSASYWACRYPRFFSNSGKIWW